MIDWIGFTFETIVCRSLSWERCYLAGFDIIVLVNARLKEKKGCCIRAVRVIVDRSDCANLQLVVCSASLGPNHGPLRVNLGNFFHFWQSFISAFSKVSFSYLRPFG